MWRESLSHCPAKPVTFSVDSALHFPTLPAQLLFASISSWALGLDPAALVCPLSVSLGSTRPPLSGRLRPAPVLSNSDEGRPDVLRNRVHGCYMLPGGSETDLGRRPRCAGCWLCDFGKCIHRSVSFFHHLKTRAVCVAGFPRWLRITCGLACTAPGRPPGAHQV